jgi:hypothetical protein|tara:strand:+ start:67923 stop:68405 length:483 start_codon:yes stop_codon:yes gene_type:complete
MLLKQMTTHHIYRLVAIGFCQQKFYKKSVWLAAKKLMEDVLLPNKLAYAHDFGRGKGKFSSDFDIQEVQVHAVEILRKNNKVLTQTGFILVTNEKNKPKRPAMSTMTHEKPLRELTYISFDDKEYHASVFASACALPNTDLQWIPVDDFICQSFVIDIAA